MAWNPSWWHMQNMASGSLAEEEQEEVSLHRSYGITKRVYPLWERIKLTFFQGLTIWLILPWVCVIIASYVMFLIFFRKRG